LQRVLEKYRGRGFVILAVNTEPEQDELVVPFIRNSKYGFVPARSGVDWKKSSYKVVGTPSNFLIDAQGRILFKPRVHNEVTERTLELEIEALVGR
jgi:hypothetical protein